PRHRRIALGLHLGPCGRATVTVSIGQHADIVVGNYIDWAARADRVPSPEDDHTIVNYVIHCGSSLANTRQAAGWGERRPRWGAAVCREKYISVIFIRAEESQAAAERDHAVGCWII